MTSTDLDRYNRQITLSEIGVNGQNKISEGSVLVVGAGGLGCPVIQYLTGAGFGEIGIIDADKISISNLQRQIIYAESEIEKYKADIAKQKMLKLNSTVNIKAYTHFLDDDNAELILSHYDIIIGATDNLESRYTINKYCKKLNKPFIHGAVSNFEGRFSVFNYNGSPSYSDVFPTLPKNNDDPLGVIGALPGIIGSHMALEAIKIVTQVGKVSSDGLYIFNGLDNTLIKLKY